MSKLPEIGKRYKNLGSNRRMEVRDGDEDVCFFCYDDAESERSIPHYDFWSEFEELPDQEPIKEHVKNLYTKEEHVKKSGKSLHEEERIYYGADFGIPGGDMTCETTYIKNKEGNFEIKDIKYLESIWKPISELPEVYCAYSILFKMEGEVHNGHIYRNGSESPVVRSDNQILLLDAIDSFCSLTGFINHQESLEQRITDLEKRLIVEARNNVKR